jgi:hypothetical protein
MNDWKMKGATGQNWLPRLALDRTTWVRSFLAAIQPKFAGTAQVLFVNCAPISHECIKIKKDAWRVIIPDDERSCVYPRLYFGE